jgi:hypothetical protein
MNTTTLTRTVAALATLAIALAVAPSAPASAGNDGHHKQVVTHYTAVQTSGYPGANRSRDVCRLDPQYLPRTPDAVEGWLRHCSR